jgi:hypothetical protein
VNQTDHSQKQQGQDYMVDASTPESSVGWGFKRCGRQCADGHCRGTLRHFRQYFSEFDKKNWFQLVQKHFTVKDIVYCCALLTLVFQNWPLCIPSLFVFNFFLISDVGCFHNLAFPFCSVMVDSRIVSSDSESQKSVTFLKTTLE